MSNITAAIVRVFVDNLEAAVPLYERLADGAQANRFAFRDVELASVGPFLLLSGNTAAYRDRVATLLVRELGPVIDAIESAGGQLLEGPAPGPNGERLIARHPDGSVFEYIQNS